MAEYQSSKNCATAFSSLSKQICHVSSAFVSIYKLSGSASCDVLIFIKAPPGILTERWRRLGANIGGNTDGSWYECWTNVCSTTI